MRKPAGPAGRDAGGVLLRRQVREQSPAPERRGNAAVVEKPDDAHALQARMAAWDGERLQEEELDWGAPVGEEAW